MRVFIISFLIFLNSLVFMGKDSRDIVIYDNAHPDSSTIKEAATTIKSHGYTFISKVADIKELRNMNTYVFFPDNISSQNNRKSKKYKRYEKVLELTQETPKYDINITNLVSKAKK